MASTSTSTRGAPQFADADAPDVAGNPSEVARFAETVGTRRVGTAAERLALAGKALFVGLLWGDTTDKLEYQYAATGWKRFGDIERVVNGRTGTPPAGTQFIHEYKFVQGLTTAEGTIAIAFAVAFPNGAGHIFFSANSGTGSAPVLNAASLTKTGCTVAFPSAPNTNVDFSYHVIGW